MTEIAIPQPDVTSEFKRAMRRLAATVTVISTCDEAGRRHGMTATAVNSVAMDPPTLLICVNHSASIHGPLMLRKRFCVNVLKTEHQELVSAFSGRLTGEERFSVGDWRDEKGSAIPYLHDAQSNLFCDVQTVIPVGTHSIIVATVSDVVVAETISPLVYSDGRLGTARAFEIH